MGGFKVVPELNGSDVGEREEPRKVLRTKEDHNSILD